MRGTNARRFALARSLKIALVTIATGAIVSSCATTPSSPPPAPAEVSPSSQQTAMVHDLTQKIAGRDRALDSLQSEAVMEYSSPDQHPPRVREQITAKRPDSLRVEAMSAFSVALILACSGPNLTIFEPSKNQLRRAAATADTLNRFIQIPMAPADAVTLLLGIAPDSSALANRTPDAVTSEDDLTVASWNGENSTRRELGFRDEQLAMVRQRDSSGTVEYEVRYSDYHDIGGIMFPYTIDATFPLAKSHVSLRYKRPIVNGEVPASAFILPPPSTEASISNAGN